METMNFKIQNRHTLHMGEALIFENYNDGTIYAENTLPGTVGHLKTNKIGSYSEHDIYENYYDSGSVDYFYFALKQN